MHCRCYTASSNLTRWGSGARDLGECLNLQLRALPADTVGRTVALQLAAETVCNACLIRDRRHLPRGRLQPGTAQAAVDLLRSLNPQLSRRTIRRAAQRQLCDPRLRDLAAARAGVALGAEAHAKVAIQRDYQQMIRHAGSADADYLRGHLQEARWLLKGGIARRHPATRSALSGCRASRVLNLAPQALRPLTLRNVADTLGLNPRSRGQWRANMYAPLAAPWPCGIFASGIDTDAGGSTSSTANQDRIRQLVAAENPRKPLSDARLADTLKAEGVPVARRTIAKYREALQIPASHERVRIG